MVIQGSCLKDVCAIFLEVNFFLFTIDKHVCVKDSSAEGTCILLKEDSPVEHVLEMRFNLNMAAAHPRWPLKCEFNTFFGEVLFVSGMVMYRDEYFVYLTRRFKGPHPPTHHTHAHIYRALSIYMHL